MVDQREESDSYLFLVQSDKSEFRSNDFEFLRGFPNARPCSSYTPKLLQDIYPASTLDILGTGFFICVLFACSTLDGCDVQGRLAKIRSQ